MGQERHFRQSNTVDVHINRLRRKIDDPFQSKINTYDPLHRVCFLIGTRTWNTGVNNRK